jgi:hypothetical protein
VSEAKRVRGICNGTGIATWTLFLTKPPGGGVTRRGRRIGVEARHRDGATHPHPDRHHRDVLLGQMLGHRWRLMRYGFSINHLASAHGGVPLRLTPLLIVCNTTNATPSGGYICQGPNGLRDFLAARAGFVKEQHDVDQVLERKDLPTGEVRINTRLTFSLRQPPGNELFTGTAFHTWLLRRDAAGQLRVAAQIVDGISNLNENATRLFATPDKGLNR